VPHFSGELFSLADSVITCFYAEAHLSALDSTCARLRMLNHLVSSCIFTLPLISFVYVSPSVIHNSNLFHRK
jgi:hypothetical protein